jgi:hypothetical protein
MHRTAAERSLLESPHRNIALRPMPLPAPTVARSLTHTRRLRFEAYRRADGLWDIEAHLTDVKPFDYRLSSGVRPAGAPVHDMWIRLTITRGLEIVDALAVTEAMP